MKNKLLFAVLSLLGAALPATARDFTYTYEGQTLTYTVIDESAKTVKTETKNKSISGNLVIPSIAKYGNIEYRVTTIGNQAFHDCGSLTSVTIPNSVTTIENHAFAACSGLASVTIPNSVTTIGEYAFAYCSGLTSVELPNSITTISDDVFIMCTGLTSIKIPDSVTSIGVGAFACCSSLTSVDISSSVTTIGLCAFSDCTNLISATIPNSVTAIGDMAFLRCGKLTSADLPDSVTSIGEFAFKSSGLISVNIPSSVVSIGNYAFYDCGSLTSVTYDAEEPIVADNTIFESSTYTNAALHANRKAIEKYKQIEPWKNFTTILPIDESGIEEVAADFDTERACEVFNLGGVRIADRTDGLTPGIYIVRQGDTTRKIAVK